MKSSVIFILNIIKRRLLTMEQAKLHIDELNKTFKISHTNKNMRKSYQFQLTMAKLGQLNDVDDVNEQMKQVTEYSDVLVDFPADVLNLTDKQKEALDEMEQDQLQELDVTLALKIQGMSNAQIADVIDSMRYSENGDADSKSEK